jgi:transmembrane sensor
MTDDASRFAGANPAPPPDWEALARYLAGESARPEAARIGEWLDANPDERVLLERLNVALDRAVDSDVDTEAALARVHSRLREAGAGRPRLTLHKPGKRPSRRGPMIAALLGAAAVAGVAVTLARRSTTISAPAVAAHTYQTAVGQRDSIVLGDGSRIMLGPDSRLDVPADYGSAARAVMLRGDAFFDVRHDPKLPFSVRVGGALIEDIGTTFTIESDNGVVASVAVVSGNVRLRAAGAAPTSGVVLGAGDRGTIDDAGVAHADEHALRDEDLAWTMGRLVFRDAPLARVAGEVRRWYGITLRVADSSLAGRHVTASFNGEPVDQVLAVIGLTLGARVERQGDTAVLRAGAGSASNR